MINDIKDLKALLKLCRSQGITDFKMNGLEIKFGDMPLTAAQSADQSSAEDPANKFANFPQGELTLEQLAFYSAGGKPEDDPLFKEAANQ